MSGLRNVEDTGAIARASLASRARYSAMSDAALMSAVCNRDVQAFAYVYERYIDLVYSTTLRVLSDSGLAEDAAQEVFVRLWRKPESFISERGRFVSWIVSVARNRAVDDLRSRARRRKREVLTVGQPADDGAADVPDESENPLRSAELRDTRAHILVALREIPYNQRHALELAYFGGLTQQEIAARLNEPLGTVKTRIRLGMKKLRSLLEEQR
jgi:RNA polymerase sigma-70 factor, ECF subfamily